MKIAIIGSRGAHSTYGGIEKVLGQLCPRLSALGHEIHVFGDRPAKLPLKRPQGFTNVYVPAFGGKYTETISRSVIGTALAMARGYDVINLVAIGSGVLSWMPRLAGVPVVVSIHGLDWQRDKWPAPARAALKLAERTIVAHANEITVVSRQLESYFRDAYGRETVYAPNGIELRAGPVDVGLLRTMGLEPNDYIAFLSRIVPEKGAHELLAAFNKVKTTKKLVIAGGGRYDQDYLEALKAADTTGRCVFTGHLTGAALDAVFQGAYLYALPSHLEGLSMSLLEAIGFGKAALVSDIPENLEVVGDCGYHFPVGNVDALADTLSRLLQAPADVEEMGRRALVRAGTMYSWAAVARQYSDVYERAASLGKTSGAGPARPIKTDRT